MNEENTLQSLCVEWFRWQYPQSLIFSIPNGAVVGGKNRFAMIHMLKKTGLLSGVADLFVMKKTDKYGGLFIEMKSKKGTLSELQRLFGEKCLEEGYQFKVCHSYDEFVEAVMEYFGGLRE